MSRHNGAQLKDGLSNKQPGSERKEEELSVREQRKRDIKLQKRIAEYKTRKCKRCGVCCANFSITLSPDELNISYMQKQKGNMISMNKDRNQENRTMWADIELVYPMLIYKRYDVEHKRYVYRCKHLARDKKGKAVCTIHSIKPNVCRIYGTVYDDRDPGQCNNKALYPGCVF